MLESRKNNFCDFWVTWLVNGYCSLFYELDIIMINYFITLHFNIIFKTVYWLKLFRLIFEQYFRYSKYEVGIIASYFLKAFLCRMKSFYLIEEGTLQTSILSFFILIFWDKHYSFNDIKTTNAMISKRITNNYEMFALKSIYSMELDLYKLQIQLGTLKFGKYLTSL